MILYYHLKTFFFHKQTKRDCASMWFGDTGMQNILSLICKNLIRKVGLLLLVLLVYSSDLFLLIINKEIFNRNHSRILLWDGFFRCNSFVNKWNSYLYIVSEVTGHKAGISHSDQIDHRMSFLCWRFNFWKNLVETLPSRSAPATILMPNAERFQCFPEASSCCWSRVICAAFSKTFGA